jgi:hypothetical protein
MNKIKARTISIFWTLFIGLGALAGGACMLIDPTGKIMHMDAMLPYFQVLPFADIVFQNLTFSGIALICVNGITQLTAAALLFKRHHLAPVFTIGCGVILMLWICIQFYMFPLNFMSTIYFIFGLLEAATGVAMKREAKKQ